MGRPRSDVSRRRCAGARAEAEDLRDQIVRAEDRANESAGRAGELAAELVDAKAVEASARAQLDAERAKPVPFWQIWATIADRTMRGSAAERAGVGR